MCDCWLQSQCVDDEYTLDGELFTVECQTAADTSLLDSMLHADKFQPHGKHKVFCRAVLMLLICSVPSFRNESEMPSGLAGSLTIVLLHLVWKPTSEDKWHGFLRAECAPVFCVYFVLLYVSFHC